ncbi:DUF4440 domain-containing protein [Leadbetterella sp. DM7]|uniref:YybH family protein n=1 Tax=Leadbetterella sp. DM7 TaxID=3235085 RepID=UPI00349E7172
MRKLFLIFAALTLTFTLAAQDKSAILDVLKRQENQWNSGNIEGFMEDYWKSPELKFIGKNGVTKGWEATKERYLRTYPDRATMGTLSFDIQEVDFHSDRAAWVLGKWALKRPEKGDTGGYFTLIFKKIENRWVIVSDHTS